MWRKVHTSVALYFHVVIFVVVILYHGQEIICVKCLLCRYGLY
jgi:hypothetical protein